MKKGSLKIEKRTIVGRKVKKLRKEGLLPATIYGKAIASLSVQVSVKEFEKVYKEVGETGLVELSLSSEKTRPVLIKNVQLDPRLSTPLHVDFYQVNLAEKIKANVPVEQVGEPKAVLDKVGVLEVPLSEVEVESLPGDLPEKIEVDVTNLANIDDQITAGDLKAPSGVTILTDGSQVLFKIGELVTKEAEELAKAEEAAAAAAAAEAGVEAAPAETQAPTEGEKPAQSPKEEEKPEEKGA
jgi:large subunit ribosomal protein L25